MVTVLGFGVGATSAHSFKMNMARRNFRAGSPHLNQVRKEDTIDSMLSPTHWFGLPSKTLFFARGVPIELKTKRTDLFEGNTLVHSVKHALTRRSRLEKKKDVANFIHSCEASTYVAAQSGTKYKQFKQWQDGRVLKYAAEMSCRGSPDCQQHGHKHQVITTTKKQKKQKQKRKKETNKNQVQFPPVNMAAFVI